jgi:hypothetical protein
VVETAAECALRLSYELEGIASRSEFLRAAAESVDPALPSDFLGWTAVSLQSGEAEVYDTGGIVQPDVTSARLRLGQQHPMWLSYCDHPQDMTPRRMSDLIALRPWRSHPVYWEVFRPLGVVHQVTVMVAPVENGSWVGWGFGRLDRDFNDDELVMAGRLQPVLVALNHASLHAFTSADSQSGVSTASRDEAVERTGLTAREVRVLELLATGLTATAIGHACRISPRTVRKHLQNIRETRVPRPP